MLPSFNGSSQPACYSKQMNAQVLQKNFGRINSDYLCLLIEYQNLLNIELLKNQQLINSRIIGQIEKKSQAQTNRTVSSTSSGVGHSEKNDGNFNKNVEPSNKNKSQHACVIELKKNGKKGKDEKWAISLPKNIVEKQNVSSSEYEPEVSDSKSLKVTKSSESKNVPKNISKAILIFIRKKQNIVRRLIDQQKLKYEDFMRVANSYKGKINTIAELRCFWLEDSNPYAKIFRILSELYIRKYSLQHVFNSRIQNHFKHLKYRHKISQVLRRPDDFTQMKDY